VTKIINLVIAVSLVVFLGQKKSKMTPVDIALNI
jgi:hypothetical protein